MLPLGHSIAVSGLTKMFQMHEPGDKVQELEALLSEFLPARSAEANDAENSSLVIILHQ